MISFMEANEICRRRGFCGKLPKNTLAVKFMLKNQQILGGETWKILKNKPTEPTKANDEKGN